MLFIYRRDSANVLRELDDESYRNCRKNIINIILATDMKNHFESISLFRVRRSAPDFDFSVNKDDLWYVVSRRRKAVIGSRLLEFKLHLSSLRKDPSTCRMWNHS